VIKTVVEYAVTDNFFACKRMFYELPSALADGQCLKKDKALAESVKLIYSLQL
jgi:hypothetical protein